MKDKMTIKITGPRGSGKSTALNLIYKTLRDAGYSVGFDNSKEHEMICSSEGARRCHCCGQPKPKT